MKVCFAFCFFYCVTFALATVLINEINTDTPECLQTNEFIELAFFENSPNETLIDERTLDGYFLAVLQPYYNELKTPGIIMLVDLSGNHFDEDKKYFVIGGPDAKPNISFFRSNCSVFFKISEQVL